MRATPATAPTTMPPMAPPERDLDEDASDVVEGGEDVTEAPPAVGVLSAVVVGAAVVLVDKDVDEDADEDALEVLALVVVLDAAINAVGSKAHVVASGSNALRELKVLLRKVSPRSRRISCCLLQQMLICPTDPVQDSLIATTLAKSLAAACGGRLTYR